jgi:general secretion pathway protein G
MKRSGFTMIELIFVIVILGILAAVAIPRLAATRDDAEIAKGASEASTLLSDMGAHYTANGEWNTTTMDKITNATTSLGATAYNYGDVFTMTVNDVACLDVNGTSDGNLSIAATAGTADTICTGVQQAAVTNKVIGTHVFGGKRITY